MGRIFSNTPMDGKPLSLRGMAKGFRLLEEIWERMEIIGGHLSWHNGRNGLIPRIVIDSLSNEGDIDPLRVWKTMDIGGVIAMYMPTNSIVVNDKDFTALQTGLTAIGVGSPDWYSVDSFKTSGLNCYITYENGTAQNQPGKPLSVEFGTVAPSGKVVTIPILAYDATQGLYSLRHSAIRYERTSFDGDLPLSKWKSISRPYDDGDWDDEDHTVGLNGFVTPLALDEDPFAETPDRDQHLAVREQLVGNDGAHLRWYNLRTLISSLKDDLVADTAWLGELGAVIGGYIDYQESWTASIKHTGVDFSGSTSAKGTGLSGGNTDHDDSYWHEAGDLGGSFFTDTKSFVTSGTVRVGAFALEASAGYNYWNGTNFNAQISSSMIFDGLDTATLYLGGVAGASFSSIYFNGIAGVDIANWTTKGGLTGATIQEISIEDAQPGDKILVVRS